MRGRYCHDKELSLRNYLEMQFLVGIRLREQECVTSEFRCLCASSKQTRHCYLLTAMGDVDMSDAGGVSVQLPVDPLQKNINFANPAVTSQIEADLYSKLKKLQRDLEFLSLQEVYFMSLFPY